MGNQMMKMEAAIINEMAGQRSEVGGGCENMMKTLFQAFEILEQWECEQGSQNYDDGSELRPQSGNDLIEADFDNTLVKGTRSIDEIYQQADVALLELAIFKEAKTIEGWKEAMQEELNMIHKNQTWELVDKPSYKKVIGVKLKVRLGGKGFSQQYGIDYWETNSKEEIYVEQPPAFAIRGKEEKVKATQILCDNQSAIAIAKNPIFYGKTKHFKINPTFIKIFKLKSVEEFKPDPYVATILNCAMWVFYGLPIVHPDSLLIITINGVGLVIEGVFVTIFFIFSNNKKRKRICFYLLIEIIFMVAVVLITLLVFQTTQKRSMFVGILAIVFNIGMYTSPLTVMRMVIKTKSVKYMPFSLSLFNFLNGVVWVIYALLKFDINVLIPNGLGTLSGLVQLILYAWFYRTTKWDEDDKAPAQQVQLSEI
ncbi:bidirectional sugar transporter SWEET4 [Gossypium raimondii]|uniref:bidirectional sugar transporter SWEET4 n=1 Tax=Gossypium raimondii TaxID=29730 RepID=UPI00227A469E|nr:bidirectional sugar transporter SWEET4 [Gossypium raimondii]